MSERGFDLRRDGLGIFLFVFGAFFAVLLLKAFASDIPASEAGGTAAFASIWIDSVGGLAGLLFNAGLAFLGARLYLSGEQEGTLRHAGGMALVAVGVSIVAGAFSPLAGGALGHWIGGGIAELTHAALAALVGVGVLAGAVWFVWLQHAGFGRDEEVRSALPQSAGAGDGVTLAEAAALIPDDLDREHGDGRKRAPTTHWTAPPSPYPEDVRRRGEIPAGAKPLESPHAEPPAPSGAPASSVYRWTAPRVEQSAHAAGADLAPVVEPEPVLAASFDVTEYEEFVDERTDEGRLQPAEAVSAAVVEDELDDAEDADDVGAPLELSSALVDDEPLAPVIELLTPTAQALTAVPRPSWEQSTLFEVSEPTEEAVDAYGTPTSLVESIVERTEGQSAEPMLAGSVVAIETDDVAAEALDDDDEFDDEVEDDEEESDEDEDEDADDEEGEDDEDEVDLDDEEEFDDEEAAEADEEEVYAAEEGEESDLEEAAERDVEELEVEVGVAVVMHETEPVAATLEDSDDLLDEVDIVRADRAPQAPVAPTELKDVVLTPTPAPAHADRSPVTPPDRQKLLVEVGCLFVERGRVAVSMLQRQYAMDFDDACKVLDELQEMGLIGPYLGGQRRDILLTRDQWLEKVASV